jgi:hypothetical protein
MLVAVQLFEVGSYLPPVFNLLKLSSTPPQMIILLPVHTAVCAVRAIGALVVLVAVQLFVPGSNLPPVFEGKPFSSLPPQTIISLPFQIAV